MVTPLTERLQVQVGLLTEQHSFLLATNSPVNLLGRDLLCKLNCTVKCTPDGVYLEMLQDSHEPVLNLLQMTIEPMVYCWKLDEKMVFVSMSEKFMSLMSAVPKV